MKTTLIVAGALALLTSACGRMADLEAPVPTGGAIRGASAPGPVEPATVNAPSSIQPIDGGPSNPIGGTAAQRDPR
ncbi:hypothetical protein [uncultured Brevundimonas sp.]|uniref:hypothetical protein n=1 Tax=uncultured Brevundimonas sp. TaxID=213418 RepID=UPI0025CD0803|nr:hypothetical protein [uncultured Brevundimonas sp.]